MIPPLIVREAVNKGIQIIAITDHNASENVAAVMQAAEDEDLVVLPGMELQTEEEVHVLCLFDTLDQLSALQSVVDSALPDIKNNVDFFGEQFIVDHTGEFVRRKEQLLITSTRLSFEESFAVVKDLEGLFIPAHVNRHAFGLIYHLGFVPPGLPIDALEISRHISLKDALREYPQISGFPLIQSGDVHYLDDFLGANQFTLQEPTIPEIKLALSNQNGRSLAVLDRN